MFPVVCPIHFPLAACENILLHIKINTKQTTIYIIAVIQVVFYVLKKKRQNKNNCMVKYVKQNTKILLNKAY